MFVIVVCGGPNDGKRIGVDGCPTFRRNPEYKFYDYADAQEFIMSRQPALNRGEYGVGATLAIDEVDGDIYDCV